MNRMTHQCWYYSCPMLPMSRIGCLYTGSCKPKWCRIRHRCFFLSMSAKQRKACFFLRLLPLPDESQSGTKQLKYLAHGLVDIILLNALDNTLEKLQAHRMFLLQHRGGTNIRVWTCTNTTRIRENKEKYTQRVSFKHHSRHMGPLRTH